jgi:uncharacterized protein (DUF486 family)
VCRPFETLEPNNRKSKIKTQKSVSSVLQSRWFPILLLVASNVFMTFAWYGHLKFKSKPLWLAILVSWTIAFLEYCLMVPANRWGYSVYSATQLKIIQEVITLTVFSGFVVAYLGERIRWNHVAAFLCIIAAVAFTFVPTAGTRSPQPEVARGDGPSGQKL